MHAVTPPERTHGLAGPWKLQWGLPTVGGEEELLSDQLRRKNNLWAELEARREEQEAPEGGSSCHRLGTCPSAARAEDRQCACPFAVHKFRF